MAGTRYDLLPWKYCYSLSISYTGRPAATVELVESCLPPCCRGLQFFRDHVRAGLPPKYRRGACMSGSKGELRNDYVGRAKATPNSIAHIWTRFIGYDAGLERRWG